MVDCVHVERQFPFFNSPAVMAEAGKQFIAKSVTGDNVDGIYLKFLHRKKLGLLQDRGRFHISPIFQMKLNFSTEIFCGSRFQRPAQKDVGRYQGQ